MRRVLIALLAAVLTACGAAATDPGTSEILDPPTTQPITDTTSTTDTRDGDVADPGIKKTVRSITVGGVGSEYAEPDRCVIEIGVTARRPSVDAASRVAADSGEAMRLALVESGVQAKDIQTSNFSVHPVYGEYPAISGFEVDIGYRVTFQDVDDVGTVLAAAIAAGGDEARAWGMRFEVDPAGLIEAARERAWADVSGRAESLAALAGEPLGDVLDVHEKVLVSTSQGMYQGGEGDSASFDIPVSPGVAGVVVLLTVTYAIGS